VCRAILDVHDGDDAWSETFLAAMRAYPDLPDTANVEAWLVAIARRKAIDVHRAANRNPLPVEELPDAPTALGIPAPATTTSGRRWAGCPRSSGAPSPSGTSAGCRTRRSRPSSAAPRMRHDEPRPTG